MPYSLRLSADLRQAGWKVKIRDRERLEPPHVTILFKHHAFRLNLRDGTFLDPGVAWADVHPRVREAVEGSIDRLRAEWDRMVPGNPLGEDA